MNACLIPSFPSSGQLHPRQLFSIGDGVIRLTQVHIREAAPSNAYKPGQCRDGPVQRGATCFAKVSRLIVVLRCKMERVNLRLARLRHDIFTRKIRRNTKRTSRAALAISAMANAVHFWLTANRDTCRATGALCCFMHIEIRKLARVMPRSALF